jgi:endoglucanase
MCPLETGLGNTFNDTYFTEFQDAVNYITMRGGYAILDAHNYMRTSSHNLNISTSSNKSQATTTPACNPNPAP